MTKGLYTLSTSGLTVSDLGEPAPKVKIDLPWSPCLLESLLDQTSVQGFPIVSNDGKRLLEGYISRTDIENILGTSVGES